MLYWCVVKSCCMNFYNISHHIYISDKGWHPSDCISVFFHLNVGNGATPLNPRPKRSPYVVFLVLYEFCVVLRFVCGFFFWYPGCVILTKLCMWHGSDTIQGLIQPYTLCASLIYAWREVRCPHLLHNGQILPGQNTLRIYHYLVAW